MTKIDQKSLMNFLGISDEDMAEAFSEELSTAIVRRLSMALSENDISGTLDSIIVADYSNRFPEEMIIRLKIFTKTERGAKELLRAIVPEKENQI